MKVLVIDDHPLVRQGMQYGLRSLAEHVDVLDCCDAREALQAIDEQPDLDLVLLDLSLPDQGGFTVLQELKARNVPVPVVILSASEKQGDIVAALNAGALGFIPKSASLEVTLHAIRLVLAGSMYIPPEILGVLPAKGEEASSPPSASPRLTERQLEVLAMMAQGKPNKIIAADLDITEATVKAHVSDILRLLKVNSRTQALLAARELKIA